jgi:hypothetical protein
MTENKLFCENNLFREVAPANSRSKRKTPLRQRHKREFLIDKNSV